MVPDLPKPPPFEDKPGGPDHAGGEWSPSSSSGSPTAPLPYGFERSPERIGAYKILEIIGEGGMGTVYLAEQTEPVHRKVALKVIKLGMDTKEVVGRFEAERQALALMDHPNIAKVLDAGVTPEGRPFFAMEHVPGVPITEYCNRHRLNNEERLRLLIPVCQAIQHAHQKAIIHRDLKPSNILVSTQEDTPVPKVIDFGVAKATGHKLTERTVFTEQGRLIGTPEYMSPEQAEMTGLNVDTRTDIYSLGVLLYELLTGELPFDSQALRKEGLEGIQHKIRHEEPLRPSTRVSMLGDKATTAAVSRRTVPGLLSKQIRGELDWITMRAMEKDRTRRYQSASELGADICRYLSHEPVLAGPPSTTYRLRKFVRRNRVGVGFAGMIVAMLLALAGTMTVQARRIAKERDRANVEAERAREVSDFLVDLFEVSDPGEARGNAITAREILDRGADKVQRGLQDQPLSRARMMDTMGKVYQNLGLYGESENLLEQAIVVRKKELGESHPEVAESHARLGYLRGMQGRFQESVALIEDALAIQMEIRGPDHLETAWSQYYLGNVLWSWGKQEQSRRLLRQAMEVFEKELGPDDIAVGWCLNDLAGTYYFEGDYRKALPLMERSIEIKRVALPPDHFDLAAGLGNLGYLMIYLGDYEGARPLLEQALLMQEHLVGVNHPKYAVVLHSLGELLRRTGDYSAAREKLEQSLAIAEASLEGIHPNTVECIYSLALLARETGQYAAADSLYRRCLKAQEELYGKSSEETLRCLEGYASFLRDMERGSEARIMDARAAAIRKTQELEAAMN
jgi:serine/threonine protein kinase/tetratricopeptide (TPR) repeat protein